jgi:DMSO/TMAO reductase YedYZ molybdopterin-dependent catalytic subunit
MAKPATASSAHDRLPPGQTLVTTFPVLSYGPTPRVDPAKWDFRVTGLVDRPLRFTFAEFRALPRATEIADFHCVTTWSRYDNRWEGIKTADLARAAAVKA